MPTRQVESTHEAEQNHPIHDPGEPGVESPSGDRMQGANGLPRDGSPDDPTGAEAGDMHAAPDPSTGGPRESLPEDKVTSTTTNEDDATTGDQDIDTAGTAHDDLSPTKSM
jgi:hypothetical protein